MKPKSISAAEFDRIVDEGKEDVLQYVDLSKARRLNLEIKRVNVDFPYWMIRALDDEAARLGITRQSVIKTWIAEKIAEKSAEAAPTRSCAGKSVRQLAESPRSHYRPKRVRS